MSTRPMPGRASLVSWRTGWQGLTREARDTLWLLAMLALVLVPHAPRLPWWANLAAAASLLWRARLAWTDRPLPRRWLLSVLLVACLAMTWFTYRTLLGREAGITLIVVLTTLKCLELRARRDSLVCLYLGFFLILTQFLHGQGLGTAALMLVGVWGLLTSLVLGQRPLARPPLRDAGREAGRAMLWGLPLMLVLFVFFPRFGPLWSLPGDAQARTGLSNTLVLGDVAELAQDESIALRLRFGGAVPPPDRMYFRGPTLDHFDGRTWRPSGWAGNTAPPDAEGPLIPYEATIEPSRLDVLPLLDGTVSAQPLAGERVPVLWQTGLEWRRRAAEQRLQVRAQAAARWRAGVEATPYRLRTWTQLPAGHNPRILAWAAGLRRTPGLADAAPRVLVQHVLAHIRQNDFRYTLSPGLSADPASPHLIDEFWFDRREGFCEHFATAFAVVLRALDVPARVVTGYQGAELNPVDGQYIVRNSNAHAWVEYWEAGRGWQRADPTAAVAPERVERSPRRPPFAGLPGGIGDLDPGALRRLRDLWDAVDHRWNTWVLQYSRGSQMQLLQSLGWRQPDWQDLGRVLAWALAALGLGGTLLLWLARDRQPSQPWDRALARVHAALVSVGATAPRGPVPASASTWRTALRSAWPAPRLAWQDAMLRALDELDAARYGPAEPRAPAAGAPAWRPLVRRIEALARAARRGPAAHLPS